MTQLGHTSAHAHKHADIQAHACAHTHTCAHACRCFRTCSCDHCACRHRQCMHKDEANGRCLWMTVKHEGPSMMAAHWHDCLCRVCFQTSLAIRLTITKHITQYSSMTQNSQDDKAQHTILVANTKQSTNRDIHWHEPYTQMHHACARTHTHTRTNAHTHTHTHIQRPDLSSSTHVVEGSWRPDSMRVCATLTVAAVVEC